MKETIMPFSNWFPSDSHFLYTDTRTHAHSWDRIKRFVSVTLAIIATTIILARGHVYIEQHCWDSLEQRPPKYSFKTRICDVIIRVFSQHSLRKVSSKWPHTVIPYCPYWTVYFLSKINSLNFFHQNFAQKCPWHCYQCLESRKTLYKLFL